MDHIRPLAHGGTNEPDNSQPLCRDCHAKKTREESPTGMHLLQSEMSVATRELFMSTPKPKQQPRSCWQATLDGNGWTRDPSWTWSAVANTPC